MDHELIDPTVELVDVEVVLREYRQALTWMADHTRVPEHCRWRQYEKTLDNVVGRVKRQETDLAMVAESVARNAFYEVAQLRTIHQQFGAATHSGLGKKLALMARGNVDYTEEKEDARSRDAAFELYMAAVVQETGLEVRLGDDTRNLEDFRILAPGFDLYVECKRPRTDETVRACSDVAFSQLTKRLAGADPDRPSFGAVAFAVDRARNPRAAVIDASSTHHIPDALTSRTAAFVTAHHGYWATRRPPRVIMALAALVGSAYVEGLPMGFFSSVVTVARFPPLLIEDGRAVAQANDFMAEALHVEGS